jgi:hypothetical protein
MESSVDALHDRNYLLYRRCYPVNFCSYLRHVRNSQNFCRGWDQTGSNGASMWQTMRIVLRNSQHHFPQDLAFPTEFGIPINAGAPNAAHNSWIVGVVNAAPYMAAAVWYVFHPRSSTLCTF